MCMKFFVVQVATSLQQVCNNLFQFSLFQVKIINQFENIIIFRDIEHQLQLVALPIHVKYLNCIYLRYKDSTSFFQFYFI